MGTAVFLLEFVAPKSQIWSCLSLRLWHKVTMPCGEDQITPTTLVLRFTHQKKNLQMINIIFFNKADLRILNETPQLNRSRL